VQGIVSVCPGAGGEQGRLPLSPAKPTVAKETVKTTAAKIRRKYVMLSPWELVELILREFSNAKSERTRNGNQTSVYVPSLSAQGFYHSKRKDSLT
jgi:hypothetical protein